MHAWIHPGKAPLPRALLTGLLLALCLLALDLVRPDLRVGIDLRLGAASLAKLYPSGPDGSYSESSSRHFDVAGERWTRLRLDAVNGTRLRSLRIDPLEGRGLARIESITMTSRWLSRTLRGDELVAALVNRHQIQPVNGPGEAPRYLSLGPDPHLVLPIDRAFYLPAPDALLAHVLPRWLLLFLLALALDAAWVRLRCRHPERVDRWGGRLRRLPETLGRSVCERPGRLLLVATLILWPLLLATQWQLARVTPFFQGPDEIPHVANAYRGFAASLTGDEGTCGQYWAGLDALEKGTWQLIRRPFVQLDAADVSELQAIQERYRGPVAGHPLAEASHVSCLSANWFFRSGYNLLTVPLYRLGWIDSPGDYLVWLRHGQSVLAVLFYLLSVLAIARGRWLLADVLPVREGVVRVWLFLALIAYLAIPQHLFLTSVVSHPAHVMPAGLFVFVSFFFRMPVLTWLGLGLSFFAVFPRRAVYALLLVLLIGWYLVLWLQRRHWKRAGHGLTAAVLGGAAAGAPLLTWMFSIREQLPFQFPRHMLLLTDWGHYYQELLRLTQYALSFSYLDWLSFYGFFGWLDTALPASGLQVYKAMLWVVAVLLLLAVFATRRTLLTQIRALRWTPQRTGAALVLLVALPVTVSLIVYTVFELRWLPRLQWGQHVQGRYFLPVWFYPIAYLFMAHALVLGTGSDGGQRVQRRIGWSLIVLVPTVLGAAGYNVLLMLDTLSRRYFQTPDVLAAYLALLR